MALLNHEETIAFLTQKEIADAVLMPLRRRYVTGVEFECSLCGAKMQITDPRFATEVMKKNPESPKCPICGETMRCISCDVTVKDQYV